MLVYFKVFDFDLERKEGATKATYFAQQKPDLVHSAPARNRQERRANKSRYGVQRPRWQVTTGRGRPMAAVADLANRAAVAVNEGAANWGMQKRIEGVAGTVEEVLKTHPELFGALLQLRFSEWEQQDFAGNRAIAAHSVIVKGYGASPWEVEQSWRSTQRIVAGLPKGLRFKYGHLWAELSNAPDDAGDN